MCLSCAGGAGSDNSSVISVSAFADANNDDDTITAVQSEPWYTDYEFGGSDRLGHPEYSRHDDIDRAEYRELEPVRFNDVGNASWSHADNSSTERRSIAEYVGFDIDLDGAAQFAGNTGLDRTRIDDPVLDRSIERNDSARELARVSHDLGAFIGEPGDWDDGAHSVIDDG